MVKLGSMEIETDRLFFCRLSTIHAEGSFEWLKENALYQFLPQEAPKSAAEVEKRFAFVTSNRPQRSGESWHNWVIFEKSTERQAGLLELTLNGDEGLLAYFVRFDVSGQGYATEAIRAMSHSLFVSGVGSVSAIVDSENAASIRVLRKVGFQLVNRVENAEYFKGRYSTEETWVLSAPSGDRLEVPTKKLTT